MIESQPSKAGLRRDGFTFKHFFAAHDRCAMKVGTDGVLLGAWTPLGSAGRVLDIGTGCGLIALMVAQRTQPCVLIDALELDDAAAAQAAENCAQSAWAERLRVIHGDVVHYARTAGQRYDLIVSNPPYFPVGLPSRSILRDQARYTATLTHEHLLDAARRLLTPEGLLSLVLPLGIGEQIIHSADRNGWHLRYRTDVADRADKPPHRVLLGLSPVAGPLVASSLILRAEHQRYSTDYHALTKDFYLGG